MGIRAVNAQRAIFLDRDGVLNRAIIKNNKPYPPASLQELEIPAAVAPALHLLKSAGFLLIVITNQPDVARGTTTRDNVESINQTLADTLPLDDFFICYHDDANQCDCRKPLPGLLLQAAKRYQINLAASFMIGDRWKDIEAGQRAGCHTIWIDNGCAEKAFTKSAEFNVTSLTDAAVWILKHS